MEQAERMVKRSRTELAPGQKGDNVAIPIPLVDRGRGDPRNILNVILDRSENDNYTLATKHGILKGAYSRNEFELCPEKLLLMSDVNCTTFVSLREAVVFGSRCGGQGNIKCNCSGSKKCQTNRSKCFKAKLKCNSRCHQSLNCKNK
ncbi:Krab-a domain-containing protein 2-like protein [Elysia marginata]|uniref:Krab-a domain-containing protein 2-like protein n=1 Tax=Elysia marginata TaxID=1093978 RepID=A0AAV4EGZ5_9GAST|nr:Krab-a domain-containing protein 2-like protein [Elysia marginata]